MCIQHFGIAHYLFTLTPNTRYFLKPPSHQQAFDFVAEALQDESNITKITGEAGTGTTMLCRKMFSALEVLENRYVTAFIPNPLLDKKHHICNRRRIKTQFRSCYELLKVIGEELIRLSAGIFHSRSTGDYRGISRSNSSLNCNQKRLRRTHTTVNNSLWPTGTR